MAVPKFVEIPSLPLTRYEPLLGPERFASFEQAAERARHEFEGLAIWHVNSTARGGGVAEILHSMLPYVRGAGIDTRWVVLREPAEFFTVTKRLHNNLHGDPGDGGQLGEEERRVYDAALADSAAHLTRLLQPGDIVYLHDPQTAGLVPAMLKRGTKVIWRCHIGIDQPNDICRRAWDFLRPYVEDAHAFVFSRRDYVWEGLDAGKAWLMPPAINPFSPKNQELEPNTVTAILRQIGLVADGVVHPPPFLAPTALRIGSSVAPSCCRTNRYRPAQSSWSKSPAGTDSRTRSACSSASSAASRTPRRTWLWSAPKRQRSPTTPRAPPSTAR